MERFIYPSLFYKIVMPNKKANEEDESGINRRAVLASGAALAGASAVGGKAALVGNVVGDQSEDFDDVMDRAYEIEREKGKDAMVSFLRDKGYGVATKEVEFSMSIGTNDPKGDGDQVSPNKVENVREEGVRGQLTGVHDTYNNEYHVGIGIELWFDESPTRSPNCYKQSYGEDPVDLASLGWNTPRTQYWELVSTDKISDFAYVNSDYSRLPGGDEWSRDSVGFTYDDAEAYSDWRGDNCNLAREYYDLGSVGVKLKPAGSHSRSDREVFGSYEHTWEKSTDGLGIGFGASPAGPVVSARLTPESEVDSTTTTTKTDRNKTLKISQDEMTRCC
jgi:hypothetical protein